MAKVTTLIEKLTKLEILQAERAKEIQDLRMAIMTTMQKDRLTQVKTPDVTVSIAKKPNFVVNEFEWKRWASEQEGVEPDLFYVTRLDQKAVTEHAKKWFKETGEYASGIQATETEYLTVRKADKK